MKRLDLTFPRLGFIVATRAALAAGLGMLAAGRLQRKRRRNVGIALAAIGVVSTIPALLLVRGGVKKAQQDHVSAAA
jgi:hypothetical protein